MRRLSGGMRARNSYFVITFMAAAESVNGANLGRRPMPSAKHGDTKRSDSAAVRRRLRYWIVLLSVMGLMGSMADARKSRRGKQGSKAADFEMTENGPHGKIFAHEASRSHVRFQKGFHRVKPTANPDIAYQFAYKHDRAPFEVRFHFAPLHSKGRKAKKGEFLADLDSPSPALAKTLQLNMNDQLNVPFNPFPAEGVRDEFGADWGYLSQIFPLDPARKFNSGYKLAMISLVHLNGVGSWVTIFLGSDIKDFDLQTPDVFHSVFFQR